jgi:hypothetical protein
MVLRVCILYFCSDWAKNNALCIEKYLFKILPYTSVLLKLGWIAIGMIIFMNLDFSNCDDLLMEFSTAYFLGCVILSMKLIILLLEISLDE